MPYFYLALAIAAESGWAIALKISDGMRRPAPAAATVVLYLLSLLFLALAVRRLDLGTTYAVWAGAGAAIIAAAGIYYFHEPANPGKLISLGLIVAGIIGLRFTTPA
jgi:quaternary ammonium compound-resistance protein SugE